ncbi:MAG TPA: mannosyltransferase family protein [Pyrinomonadaceae bacterium]|nr:mannosyltransferase family protein [Pyrinomonadaceae bacterium]
MSRTQWLFRFRQDRSIREALFVFLLTRGLIFLIFIVAGQFSVVSHPESNTRDAIIRFEPASISENLRRTMWQADVIHYVVISQEGYHRAPFDINDRRSHEYAFFPLFPMLLWLLGRVTTGVVLWGAVLCNVFFFIALVLLHKLTLAFGYDDSVAGRTIFYLAVFPFSYFFSIPLTESLFVLLTVASFYAAKREHWWTAGIIGLLASATRLTGVLLLPSLLVLSWQMYRSLHVRKIMGLLLIPCGLFAYMFYSWWLSGDALAFKHAAEAWGRKPSLFFLPPLVRFLYPPHVIADPWNIYLLSTGAAVLCFICIYILTKRREWALALYTLMSVIIPLSSGVTQSLGRYSMGFFPVFIALGLGTNSNHTDQATRVLLVFLLGIMTLLFAAGFTNALS